MIPVPRPLANSAVAGAWSVDLDRRWNVGRNQNGGVLLAAVATALRDATGHAHPLAVSGQFLAPAQAGAASITITVAKPGRTYSTASGVLRQGDRDRLLVLGSFGDLALRTEQAQLLLNPPPRAIADPSACIDLFEVLRAGPAGNRAVTPSLQNFEVRVDPDTGWGADAEGAPSLSGWLRFREPQTPGVEGLIIAADAFPPSILSVHKIGWLPTIDLSVHLFGVPSADRPWLRAELRTRSVVGDLVEEDGELWDTEGRLLARFRQLALILRPRGG